MRIAYVIRAHHAPAQLERLVRRLRAPESSFYVHVNSRTDNVLYDDMRGRLADVAEVTWVPRVAAYWGDFSLLEATLVSIEAIAGSGSWPEYTLLLSGQDYPLRTPAEIAGFFRERPGTSYMDFFSLPNERWAYEKGGLNRIRYPHFARVKLRTHPLRLPLPRRFPRGFAPYGGSGFWNLTGECLQHVHGFVAENPGFVRFFHRVKFPDELFFHTIIMNSPLRETIRNDDLRYQDWSAGRANPATLTADDLPAMLASGKLLARKFDITLDAAILDQLDREALYAT